MEPRIDEVAENIFRISLFAPPEEGLPEGFTFNQFLVDAEEPLLYHTGLRSTFPAVSDAVERIVGLDRLRWVAFSHVEADECGAMNEFLAACPHAQVIHGATGVELSIADMADREPRVWGAGEVLEIGDHAPQRRVLQFDTPHVPHNWEAQVIFEEESATLFAGDLGTQAGDPPALARDDLIDRAVAAQQDFGYLSSPAATVATLRRLADLEPRTVAIMHGGSYHGDGGGLLRRLADAFEQHLDDRELAAAGSLPSHDG